MKISKFKWLCLIGCMTLALVACSEDEQESSANETTDEQNDEVVEEETTGGANSEEGADTDTSEETSNSNSTAPEDQGAMEGWFEGEIEIAGNTVTATGTTNLLPGSELTLVTDPLEGTVIGSNSSDGVVEEDGTFHVEKDIPENAEGFINLELKFESAYQEEEISSHYADNLAGSFSRTSTDINNDVVSKKFSFKEIVSINEGDQTIDIMEPSWEAKDDLGNTNVKVDASVSREGDHLVVELNSNLVDGTYVSGKPVIPGYIATGFMAFTHTNPDGSALLYIKNPEKDDRIEDLEEFEILIEMDPGRHENGPHVNEAYGENGEKLEGELVKELDDKKVIEKKISVTAE
ncbi:hypothetical protein [Oceanobacillus kapialis]|uniref:hypothetical protein n=1 Tax=Oceanobacillus kapialis TaxID=481353 RepID=UPI00384BD76B